ncbi:MAG: transposase domain-containing protein, partial [Bacteroidales bacterium]|nr:transposase domain-containing protein [Bacteroidales bacterium]
HYLFSHDDTGAEDNAVFYSLLESCDVVQLNPREWLTEILGKLKDHMDEDEIMQLLPYQYKKSRA